MSNQGIMKRNWKENNKQKDLFKSYYCAGCNQRKVCGLLTDWDSEWKSYCCWCYYQKEEAEAAEFSSYEEVLVSKQIDRERRFRQLQLLKGYRGCKECGSLAVDAYSLYENNRLVCQPCLMRKEGGSSGPISFSERSKWYKKRWRISLIEWLEVYQGLPVNAECAREWLKDKEHLKSCQCLEREAQENYLLFSNSFQKTKEELEKCRCEISEKVRVDYLDSEGSGWIYCEKCEGTIESAGHHGIIKNRNDPKFWGLSIEEKVLCGGCLEWLVEEMPKRKNYLFWEYKKRGYWDKNYLITKNNSV